MERYPTRRSDFSPFFGEFGRFFDQIAKPQSWRPAMDAYKDDDGNLVYRFDMPGISREDLKIRTDHGNLIISGERKAEISSEGHFERSYGHFSRMVSLPRGVGDISAKLDNGVLTVKVGLSEDDGSQEIAIE